MEQCSALAVTSDVIGENFLYVNTGTVLRNHWNTTSLLRKQNFTRRRSYKIIL